MADKQLFDQTIDETPDSDDRLAYGKPGVEAKNMTMDGLVALIDAEGIAAAAAANAQSYAVQWTNDTLAAVTLTWDLTGNPFTIVSNVATKIDKMVFVEIAVQSPFGDNTSRKLGSINSSPNHMVRFPGALYDTVTDGENSYGYITSAGDIYLSTGKADKDYTFNFTFIHY